MGLLDEAIREHLELKRRRGADASEVARQEQEALGPPTRGPAPLELPPDLDEGTPAGMGNGLGAEHGAEDPLAATPELSDFGSDIHGIGAPELDLSAPGAPEPLSSEAGLDAPESGREDLRVGLEGYEPGADVLEPGAEVSEPQPDAVEPEYPASAPTAEHLEAELRPPTEDAPSGESPGDETQAFTALEQAELTGAPPPTEALPPEPGPELPPAYEEDLGTTPDEAAEPEDRAPLDDLTRLDEHPQSQPDEEHDDLLEETPDFLQETPEHDRLWFEQRPPRDFDFDK